MVDHLMIRWTRSINIFQGEFTIKIKLVLASYWKMKLKKWINNLKSLLWLHLIIKLESCWMFFLIRNQQVCFHLKCIFNSVLDLLNRIDLMFVLLGHIKDFNCGNKSSILEELYAYLNSLPEECIKVTQLIFLMI